VTRVIRAFIRAWPIVFPALLAWAALATIAPEWFQVRSDIVVAVTNLLLHPATIRILLALTVIWLAVYLRRLEPQDLRRLESRLEALEKRPKPVGDVAQSLSFGDVAQSAMDIGLLDEPISQRKMQDTSTVAALNRLLTDGDDLLSGVKNIGVWNQSAKCSHAPRWTPENRPVVDGAKPASGRAAPSESVVPRSSVIEQAPHVGSGQSRRGLRPRPQLRQCRVKGVTIWSRRISEGLMTPRKRRWWGHG